MPANHSHEPIPPSDPVTLSNPQRTYPWKKWLIRNPFFPFSAGLLIYGVYRLSVDPEFLGSEQANLIFNFIALQVYEMMTVGVAILLARRRIWEDATFLVVLENILVLAPFFLLTQAIYIGNGLTATLGVVGMSLAVLRWSALRRHLPALNHSKRLHGFFIVLLTGNALLPFLHMYCARHDPSYWEAPALVIWWIILPLLQLALPWMPASGQRHGPTIAHPLLSWISFHLWMVGSAVNLWGIGYVSDLPLQPILLAPFLWTMGWTTWISLPRFLNSCRKTVQCVSLPLPLFATLAAFDPDQLGLFSYLTLLNILGYATVFAQTRDYLARHLAILSLAIATMLIPREWASSWLLETHPAGRVTLGLWIFFSITSMLEKKAQWLAGSVLLVALVPLLVFRIHPLFLGVQMTLMFIMLYCLRWFYLGTAWIRIGQWFFAAAWIAQSILWVHWYPASAELVEIESALVLAAVLLVWAIRRDWGPWPISWAACAGMLASSVHRLAILAWQTPVGLMAIAGAFVLFGAGTILAWNRYRWFPTTASNSNPAWPRPTEPEA